MAKNTAKSIYRRMVEAPYVLYERAAKALDNTLELGTLSASMSG
jgi:hypothetical protein